MQLPVDRMQKYSARRVFVGRGREERNGEREGKEEKPKLEQTGGGESQGRTGAPSLGKSWLEGEKSC